MNAETRYRLIKLGATNPELRPHIRPILAASKEIDYEYTNYPDGELKKFMDTVAHDYSVDYDKFTYKGRPVVSIVKDHAKKVYSAFLAYDRDRDDETGKYRTWAAGYSPSKDKFVYVTYEIFAPDPDRYGSKESYITSIWEVSPSGSVDHINDVYEFPTDGGVKWAEDHYRDVCWTHEDGF
jgi:hypothetical protein